MLSKAYALSYLCMMRYLIAFIGLVFLQNTVNAQVSCGHHKSAINQLKVDKYLRRSAADLQNYDLIYHRLELKASPKVFWLEGNVTSYFRFTQSSNRIAFNLRQHMKVDSVKQRGVHVNFTHVSDVVTVNFPLTYSANYFDSITLFYSGNATQGKYRSFFIEGHKTGRLLATQSEPYGAPDWWPCKQDLNDKFDSCDVIIDTDTGLLAGGPGLLITKSQINDTQMRFHWRHRYPSNFYLIALAISNYQEVKDSVLLRGKWLPIINYVYPQSVNPSINLLKNTGPILSFFDSVFGAYPYINEKYGHMQWNTSGGMEHATMSSMGSYNFDLVAHEAAHQWFGDKVTCSSWQDIWINESFATYLNALAYESFYGRDSFNRHMGDVLERAKHETNLSVFVEDTTDVGRIFNQDLSYQKGAMVLHTLRYYIGDEAFFQACRNFLNAPNLSFASASTQDLIDHFQALTTKDVNSFISSFYYGKGYPTYLVRWNHKNKQTLELQITQSQINPATAFFRHDIPLHINTDTGVMQLHIEVMSAFEKIEIPLNVKVSDVFFNLNNEVLATGTVAKIEESLDEEFTISPNPSDGNFTIRSNKIPLQSVIIYDSQGKKVKSWTDINQYSYPFSLAEFSTGNFILQIETEEGIFIKRYAKH